MKAHSEVVVVRDGRLPQQPMRETRYTIVGLGDDGEWRPVCPLTLDLVRAQCAIQGMRCCCPDRQLQIVVVDREWRRQMFALLYPGRPLPPVLDRTIRAYRPRRRPAVWRVVWRVIRRRLRQMWRAW